MTRRIREKGKKPTIILDDWIIRSEMDRNIHLNCRKVALKIALAAIVILTLFVFILAIEESHAATPVGKLDDTVYYDFEELVDDLDDNYEGKTVTITMLRNWDSTEDEDFAYRMIIPKNCKATLNMDGYVFDRDLSRDNDWLYNGELICVRSGSTLTINGGDKSKQHKKMVYDSVDSSAKASKEVTFSGGLLTGGCSTGGAGGIHVEGDVTLVMNDVTLAGCRAECPWYDSAGTNSGYGGGIWVKGGNTKLQMTNSTIMGNHAQLDGGGIFTSNKNGVTIELTNSHVDSNFARSDGGGIDMDGEKLSITGHEDSTVSNNVANERGGGIYLWNDEVSVSGLTIEGNKANQGGGIYTLEEQISLSSLKIKKNKATDKGGGIYIANDANTINDCDIQENDKYGIYVEDDVDVDFFLNGSMTVNGNTGGNLKLEDDSSRVTVSPNRNTDIHIGYVSSKDIYQISPYFTKDVRKYLTPDDSSYVVTYDYSENKNGRANYLVKEDKWQSLDPSGDEPAPEKQEPVKVLIGDSGPKTVARVNAGGEKASDGKYALIRGLSHHQKTDSGGDDTENVFYYSDGFFYGDPYEFNEHMATTAWSFAFAGMYLRSGWSHAESYKYKHTGARQFLADIGCPDQNIYVNDCNINKPGTDTIGVAIGSKNLQEYNDEGKLVDTGDILIPITVRGGGYEKEWTSNVTLGAGEDTGDESRDSESKGFSQAADQVMDALEYYIEKYSLKDELKAGKVKFWVSGFSRAGATANITSKRLVENYAAGTEGKNNQVFAYTCEAPGGGTDKAEMLDDKTKYYCIHNLVNYSDVVPLAAPREMGFKRYGVDHYNPGTDIEKDPDTGADIVTPSVRRIDLRSGQITVTTYSDNKWLDTKPDKDGNFTDTYNDYRTRRTEMLKHLNSIDSEIPFDDFFQPFGISIFPPEFRYTGRYNGSYLGDFLVDFTAFFQQKVLEEEDFQVGRKGYAKDKVTLDGTEYTTYEAVLRDIMSTDTMSRISGDMSKITDLLSFNIFKSYNVLSLFDDVVGDWHTLSEHDKLKYMNYFWSLVRDSGTLDQFTEADIAKIEKNLPTLLNMVLNYLDGDWNAYPDESNHKFPSGKEWAIEEEWYETSHFMMYSLTLYKHLHMILKNHDPELNMAWSRTYDSYFDNDEDMKEYVVTWGDTDGKPIEGDSYRVDAPEAAVAKSSNPQSQNADDQEYESMLPDDKNANVLRGSKKILLEVGEIGDASQGNGNVTGEAIYYDLIDITDGEDNAKTIENEQLYRGGIDLAVGTDEGSKKYKIKAYARSYGINSDEVTYYITMRSDKHTVAVFEGSSTEPLSKHAYAGSEKVALTARDLENKVFEGWKVESGGTDVTDVILGTGENSKAFDKSVTFVMPEGGSNEWPDDYSLKFTAKYFNKIGEINVSGLSAPVAGEVLDGTASLGFNNGAEPLEDFPVTWSYKQVDRTMIQPDGSIAYRETDYIASITILQDRKSKIVFADEQYLNVISDIPVENITTTKNEVDGSVTIEIVYDTTSSDIGPEQSPYVDFVRVGIRWFDLNKDDYDTSISEKIYFLIQDSSEGAEYTEIKVTASDMEGKTFRYWNLGDTGISIVPDDLTARTATLRIPKSPTGSILHIDACYASVINEISAEIETEDGSKYEPVTGEMLPGKDKVSLKIKDTLLYEVSPENVELTWSPADKTVLHMTPYTATVSIKPDSEGFIKVRESGSDGDYENYKITDSVVDESTSVTIDGDKAAYDAASISLSKSFEPIPYILRYIKSVRSVEDLEHGKGASDVKAALPGTTSIIVDDGSEMDAAIHWDEPEKTSESDDPLDGSEWTVNGTIELPDSVTNPDGFKLSTKIKVNVKEADSALAPQASIAPGEYLADQVVTLSTRTKDGEIWYSVSDTKDEETPELKKYEGENIIISRNAHPDGVIIRAMTKKSGMKDSTVSTLQYEFSSDIPVPEGYELPYNGNQQIGVVSSPFYTIESADDGVVIDGSGNACATNAGTYKVICKLADSIEDAKWVTGKDEEGKPVTTKDDQEITFTISKADIAKSAYIYANTGAETLKEFAASIKVVDNSGNILDPEDYEIKYAEKPLGIVTVTAVGRRNYTGYISRQISYNNRQNKKGEDGTAFGPGAAIEAAEAALDKWISEKDPKGSKYAPLKLKSTKQTKKSVRLTWKKAKGAKKYILYGVNCGKKNKLKKLATFGASKRSYTVKKIRNKSGKKVKVKKTTYYKFMIIAVDSKNNIVSTSKIIHAATKGNIKKAANLKKVVVKAKITKTGKKLRKWKSTTAITLRAGTKPKKLVKATKLKATFTKARKAKVRKHVRIRFESSNVKIAKVSTKGKVTAKKKGSCKIYVIGQNGVCKTVTVRVK